MIYQKSKLNGLKISDVIAKAKEIEAYLRRDLPVLVKFNVSEELINELHSLIVAADNNQTDEVAVNKKVVATTAKNNAKNALVNKLEDTGMLLFCYFKGNANKQRLFALKNLSRLTEAQLTNTALNFINLLNDNPDTLKAANISAEFMNNLTVAYNSFVEAMATCVQTKRDRKESTINGNQLLNELMQQIGYLRQIAKHCWSQQSDSRYTDYLLFRRSKSTASPPETAAQPETASTTTNDKNVA